MAKARDLVVANPATTPPAEVLQRAREFIQAFHPQEVASGPLLLLQDAKSAAFYIICHLSSSVVVAKADTDAVLDPEDTDEYKFNRDIYTDTYAYRMMEQDAKAGRSFEDIVVEFDKSYRASTPLKVYGGQHRVTAISQSAKTKPDTLHGLRVYFALTTDQRLEIATVNNTSIAIANDLLDRMQEEWMGTELRVWCQNVGLLSPKQNFADKRNSLGIPTVRIARTLLVNYFKGKGKAIGDAHEPEVCSSGTQVDPHYEAVRKTIDWNARDLKKMGEECARLHALQRERVNGRLEDSHQEYANKSIHPCVAAAWAYAAGLLESNPAFLKAHYELTASVGNSGTADPLNAKAMSSARLKGVDPDTYRGLGARINGSELGRMLELFLLQASKATKRGVNLKLANAAIQSYEAKKARLQADKAMKGI